MVGPEDDALSFKGKGIQIPGLLELASGPQRISDMELKAQNLRMISPKIGAP